MMQEITDEKNSLMKKKINYGKLAKKKNQSEIIGIPIH